MLSLRKENWRDKRHLEVYVNGTDANSYESNDGKGRCVFCSTLFQSLPVLTRVRQDHREIKAIVSIRKYIGTILKK